MTLLSRLSSLITAVGADVKTIQSQITYNEQAMYPTSVLQANMPISSPLIAVTSLASQRLTLVRCPVKKDQQISAISFFSVAAIGVPLNQVFALYDQNRNLIGTTSDDTTTAWGSSARKRLVLSSPYTPSADGWVYVGIMVRASVSVPTLLGITPPLNITELAPIMHGHSNTGLTNPASFPSTANALTALASVPLVMLD